MTTISATTSRWRRARDKPRRSRLPKERPRLTQIDQEREEAQGDANHAVIERQNSRRRQAAAIKLTEQALIAERLALDMGEGSPSKGGQPWLAPRGGAGFLMHA